MFITPNYPNFEKKNSNFVWLAFILLIFVIVQFNFSVYGRQPGLIVVFIKFEISTVSRLSR